jgi:hypothetical protein
VGATGAVGVTGGVGTGAVAATGGQLPTTGGAAATGGEATGGEVPTCNVVTSGPCSETSATLKTVDNDWGYARADVDGDLKTYMFSANWWGAYNNQVVTIDGLGFRISGSASNSNPDRNAPDGFPTMFIGSYAGRPTVCSDLPIQVSAINEIPTVFQSNVMNVGNSDLNAAYDVWFTATSAELPETQYNPGSGGAFLMVWMHKPSNRQPVGSTSGSANIAGHNWTVWYGTNSGIPVVSYVNDTGINGLTFDLNEFIQNAVQNGRGVTNNQYLSIIFAGFEVWSGGDGLEMSQFCADVR